MNAPRTTVHPLVIADNTWTLPYLSLGMIAAYLRDFEAGRLAAHYDIKPLFVAGPPGHSLAALYEEVAGPGAGVYLFSSYVWNHHRNLEVARELKSRNPDSLVLFGGPEVPKFDGDTENFLLQHSFIDIAVLGEGEASCAAILVALEGRASADLSALADINGIVFSHAGGQTRTASRDRIKDINLLPSPYLTGEFGDWFYDFSNTILETNRGCPYGCTYCDWGSATLQKVTKFEPARVIAEIEFLAQRRAQVIFIADANFGMLEQDIEIATALVEISQRTGFPKKLNTNFAKNGGRRLMSVISILHKGGLLPTGIIALQTTDPVVLKAIRRDNIKTSTYEKMMEYFNAQRIPIATDLMIGLPGQTVDSLADDLQYCFDWKVSANGNFTSMMPNAPMAEREYVREHQIRVDSDGLIASTSTFSDADMFTMKALFTVYQFQVRLGILKYILYYLQMEHGIPAIVLLRNWLDAVIDAAEDLPISNRLYREIIAMESRGGDWVLLSWGDDADFFFRDIESYYREMFAFVARTFGVEVEPSVAETLIKVQAAVTPRMKRTYPHSEQLEHDVLGYFDQLKAVSSLRELNTDFTSLSHFGPGKLAVTPRIKTKKSISFTKVSGHMDDWELPSELRFY